MCRCYVYKCVGVMCVCIGVYVMCVYRCVCVMCVYRCVCVMCVYIGVCVMCVCVYVCVFVFIFCKLCNHIISRPKYSRSQYCLSL